MKKYLSGLLTGILITLTITAFAVSPIKEAYFNSEIKIVDSVKGQLNTEIVTVVKDGDTAGRNYVSVADLSSALGKAVTWDGSTKTINLSTPTPTPAPSPSNTSGIKKTTYKGVEAIEKDGIVYVAVSYLNLYNLKYDANIITFSKNNETISFSKTDTNYCIVYAGKTYVKTSIIE